MPLRGRRALYFTFIGVFVLAGAALLFFLQGYRYNMDKGKIERTGAIQADSLPEGAQIKLNGQVLEDDTTPATLLSLRPSNYEVELNLPGFQPWRKELPVNQSAVTFTGPVRLWPNATTGDGLGAGSATAWHLSPNGENLLYLTQPTGRTELWLLNLTSGQARLLQRTAATDIVSVEWAPTSRELLIKQTEPVAASWYVFSLETNTWENVTLPEELSGAAVHWGTERALLYAATGAELYEFNRTTRATKLVWRERLRDFRVHDGLVFGLARGTGEGQELKLLSLNTLQLVPLAEAPALSTSADFLAPTGDWLPLFDHDRHTLYLLHSPLTESNPVRRLGEVTAVSWTGNDQLVITNNFEIWLYKLGDESPSFVERLSSSLSGAQLFADEPYLLFVAGHEVWALELDERSGRQRWLIASYDHDIRSVFVTPAADVLIVVTANDIYRLNLWGVPPAASAPTSSLSATIRTFLHRSNRP